MAPSSGPMAIGFSPRTGRWGRAAPSMLSRWNRAAGETTLTASPDSKKGSGSAKTWGIPRSSLARARRPSWDSETAGSSRASVSKTAGT
jgi:hypothetical protein